MGKMTHIDAVLGTLALIAIVLLLCTQLSAPNAPSESVFMKPSAPDHTLTLTASTDKWCPKYFYVTRLQNGYIVKTGIDREIFCETLEGVERALMDFSLCGTPKTKGE